LLQLEKSFCLPPCNVESIIIEYIKYINNLLKVKGNNKTSFRNKFFPLLPNIKNVIYMRTKENDLISSSFSTTKQFLKDDPPKILTRIDKKNTVVINKIEYVNKMELLLQNTYIILNCNPINKLLGELQKILKIWKQQG